MSRKAISCKCFFIADEVGSCGADGPYEVERRNPARDEPLKILGVTEWASPGAALFLPNGSWISPII